jgi:hypothetical protein
MKLVTYEEVRMNLIFVLPGYLGVAEESAELVHRERNRRVALGASCPSRIFPRVRNLELGLDPLLVEQEPEFQQEPKRSQVRRLTKIQIHALDEHS